MLSRGVLRYTLTSLVVFLTFWNLGMGLAAFVLSLDSTLVGFSGGAEKIIAPFALGTAIATDVAVTSSLVFLLNSGRTGFSKTNRLINRLIFYAIQIGAITIVADAVIIVLNVYIQNPNVQFSYIGVYSFVGNLYANSLLASLNARVGLRADQDNIHMSTMDWNNTTTHAQSGPYPRFQKKPSATNVVSVGTIASQRPSDQVDDKDSVFLKSKAFTPGHLHNV